MSTTIGKYSFNYFTRCGKLLDYGGANCKGGVREIKEFKEIKERKH